MLMPMMPAPKTMVFMGRSVRDIQALRSALEAALFNDGGKAFQGGGIVGAHGLELEQKRVVSAALAIRCAAVFGVSLILLLVECNVAHTAPHRVPHWGVWHAKAHKAFRI